MLIYWLAIVWASEYLQGILSSYNGYIAPNPEYAFFDGKQTADNEIVRHVLKALSGDVDFTVAAANKYL